MRSGGACSFIVPKPSLSSESYEPLRDLWLANGELCSVADAGMPFPEVGVEAIIAVMRKDVPCEQIAVYTIHPEGPVYLNSLTAQLCTGLPFKIIPLRLTSTEIPIIRKVQTTSIPFQKLAGLTRGIEAGKDAPFIHKQPGPELVPLGFGEDLHRYNYQANYWVRRDEKDVKTFKPIRLYARTPKLLLRRVGIDLVAAVDITSSNVLNTIYVAEINENVPLSVHYLCALINSPILAFWFKRVFVFEDRLFPYARVSQISWLPIRRIAFTTLTDERARRVEEGKALAEAWVAARQGEIGEDGLCAYPFPHFLNDDLGQWLQERLSPVHTPDPELVRQHNAAPMNREWQLPEGVPGEQSDIVHDLLAYLAENMLRMNREKHEEIRRFLAWLEREIGVSLENLTGHSRLRDYPGDYQKGEKPLSLEDVLEILRRNRRRLKVDPGRRAFQELLEKEYQDSLAKLLPLKRQLAATDRLIDLIVYRLYGLTEEEVQVVEKSLVARSPDERDAL